MSARLPLAAALLGLLAGCFQEYAPTGGKISCASDDDCPTGTLCRAAIGRCVDSGSLNEEPPSLLSAQLSPAFARAGATLTATFQVSGALSADPVVAVGGRAAAVLEAGTDRAAGSYTFTYQVAGTEPEGDVAATADLVGAAGNEARGLALGTARLDFTAPSALGSASVMLTPAGCPLGASLVSKATWGTGIAVGFMASEALEGGQPRSVALSNGTQVLELSLVSAVGLSFQYLGDLPFSGELEQGEYSLRVSMQDLAGNAQAVPVPLAAPLVVDTEPPAAPAVDVPGAVVYQRFPFGGDENRGGTFAPKTFRVVAGAGAVDADAAWVVAYDGADPLTAAQIGQGSARDGTFETLALNRADRTEVWLAAYDQACNRSEIRQARDVEWTGTLGYKVPGSTFENPLTFATTPALAPTLSQDRDRTHEPGSGEVDGLSAVDGAALRRDAEATWRERTPGGALPSARWGHRLAYDSARGRALAFGGSPVGATTRLDETWELEPETGTWTNLAPLGARPPASSDGALAYDSARRKVVMVGGTSSELLSDTWELDPESGSWSDRTPLGPRPPAAWAPSLAYDSARDKVVFVGGNDQTETWEWDGATRAWTERTPAGDSPPGRHLAAMAYDSARGKVVFFGGYSGGEDVWEWDGAAGQWTLRSVPAGSPRPDGRSGHALVYDGGRDKVVLVGGNAGPAEVWDWDGATGTWTDRSATAGPRPSPVADAAVAYDSARGRILVVGGEDWDPMQSWEWDGATGRWIDRTPRSDSPGPRMNPAMAFDGRGLVLFGGESADYDGLDDTWRLDAGGRWSQVLAATRPPSRFGQGMAYDSGRDKVLMFGGFGGDGPLGDLWEWDGALRTWTALTPAAPVPSARGGHGMAYDSDRGKVVMFGSASGTWEYDGASRTWTERQPPLSPPGGVYLLAYDAARRRTVAFDWVQLRTWEWNGRAGTWTERANGAAPPDRNAPAMAYDSASARVVLFGGSPSASGTYQDVWEWDGELGAWIERAFASDYPTPRYLHAMAADPARERLVAFGGVVATSTSSDVLLDDTWELDRSAAGRAGATLQVPFAALGMDALATPTAVSAVAFAGGIGHPAGLSAPGAELLLWDEGRWKAVGDNAAAETAPALLSWSDLSQALLSRLFLGRTLDLAIAPRYPNGVGMSALVVDYVEVKVAYRLPQ